MGARLHHAARVPSWADVDASRLEGLQSYAELWSELGDESVGSMTRDARAHADREAALLALRGGADGGSASVLTDGASGGGAAESKGHDDDDEAIEVSSLLSIGSPVRASRAGRCSSRGPTVSCRARRAASCCSPSTTTRRPARRSATSTRATPTTTAARARPRASCRRSRACGRRPGSRSRRSTSSRAARKFGVSSENACRRERDIPTAHRADANSGLESGPLGTGATRKKFGGLYA